MFYGLCAGVFIHVKRQTSSVNKSTIAKRRNYFPFYNFITNGYALTNCKSVWGVYKEELQTFIAWISLIWVMCKA